MTPLLSCQSLTKAYAARPLFTNISIGFSSGERIGLIGPNGSGKTTLLRILAGDEKPDTGELSRKRALRLVYVAQEESFEPGQTVGEILAEAIRDEPLEEYERAALLGSTLAKVGFADSEQAAGTLSGGWRKRLSLARALIRTPELLLLDEPTNHLDLEGVLWLENLLKSASFALLVVSHDRYFLENVANRIVELNRAYPEGYLSSDGAYSDFLLRKEDFLAAQAHQQQALEHVVKREVEWLRRGPQARTTKADSRIRDAGRLIDELAEVKYRNSQDRAVEIDFTATRRKTKELIVAKQIGKSLGGRRLFGDLNVSLAPGVRLGLLGPNGSGKTTLLRTLTGEIEPDTGSIKVADRLRIIRFDQDRELLNRDTTLRLSLSPNGDTVIYRESAMHISSWAKRFLFRPDQLDMPVSSLSGGEQARILIANLMLQPADVLVLDEPTNDLDIPSLEVLEESLADFTGALVLVTHDRYMLDNVSTELLALDGEGGAGYFADYAQWESRQREREEPPQAIRTRAKSVPLAVSAPRRLSTAEQRELGQMEAKITAGEEEVAALQNALSDPAVAADHVKLQNAWQDLQRAQERVAALYTRWEELETKRSVR